MDIGTLIFAGGGLIFLVFVALFIRKQTQRRLPAPGVDPEKVLADHAGKDSADLDPFRDEADVPVPPAEAAPKQSLSAGLAKTKTGFMAKLNAVIFGRGLDEGLVDELEALLVTSDIGIRTAEKLLEGLKQDLSKQELKDPAAVKKRLEEKIRGIVAQKVAPLALDKGPTVLMVIGVNGVGKTTTIGKLAARYTQEGKKVVLAAGDTFRAAAVQQLEIWGERAGCVVVKGPNEADPASVIFEAIQKAKAEKADLCICDTAGRLHTKVNLMEELKKLKRVMNKAHEGAPHEVLLVLDATTGQNAITQARQFKEAVEVSSLALTKLDGTAKGGVVVAICDELGLPVRYIGIGEKVDDLRDFNADEFVGALFEET
ncbi:MAG: signal recognition particle-docking protein FtsY [Deltaproteobacteria bacterium]|jgi:fused signal recognition particle receptor|nr:signal recognition particle-docking protein FtsY [Deltaproteobacteria bacterium]